MEIIFDYLNDITMFVINVRFLQERNEYLKPLGSRRFPVIQLL